MTMRANSLMRTDIEITWPLRKELSALPKTLRIIGGLSVLSECPGYRKCTEKNFAHVKAGQLSCVPAWKCRQLHSYVCPTVR